MAKNKDVSVGDTWLVKISGQLKHCEVVASVGTANGLRWSLKTPSGNVIRRHCIALRSLVSRKDESSADEQTCPAAVDKPTDGKVYRLTGGPSTPCVAAGNTWAESEVATEIVVDRASLAGLRVLDKDATRYAMGGLHVGPDGFTGTNGKALVQVSHNGTRIEGVTPRVISGRALKALRLKKADSHVLEAEPSSPLSDTIGDVKCDHVVGHFPPFADVLDPERNRANTVRLNVEILRDVVASLRDFGAEFVEVYVAPGTGRETSPVVFQAKNDGRTLIALQMPVSRGGV